MRFFGCFSRISQYLPSKPNVYLWPVLQSKKFPIDWALGWGCSSILSWEIEIFLSTKESSLRISPYDPKQKSAWIDDFPSMTFFAFSQHWLIRFEQNKVHSIFIYYVQHARIVLGTKCIFPSRIFQKTCILSPSSAEKNFFVFKLAKNHTTV